MRVRITSNNFSIQASPIPGAIAPTNKVFNLSLVVSTGLFEAPGGGADAKGGGPCVCGDVLAAGGGPDIFGGGGLPILCCCGGKGGRMPGGGPYAPPPDCCGGGLKPISYTLVRVS